MDHHLRSGLRFLYDLADRTQHVPDRRAVKKADAETIWWQVGILPGYSTIYNHIPDSDDRYFNPSQDGRKQKKKKTGKKEYNLSAHIAENQTN